MSRIWIVFVLCIAFTASGVSGEGSFLVYIEPPSVYVYPGEEFTVSIKVDPGGKGVSGGEVNLEFDPVVLKVIGVEPGDLFGVDPLVGVKEIENESGSVRYALARKGETKTPTGAGVFAVVSFKVLEKTGGSDLTLTKVGFADENFEDVVDVETQGACVNVLEEPLFSIQLIMVVFIIGCIVVGVLVTLLMKSKK
jgi:hypothetical protein